MFLDFNILNPKFRRTLLLKCVLFLLIFVLFFINIMSIFFKNYLNLTFFYTQSQYITGFDPFTCWDVEDGSLVSRVVTK